MASKLPSMMTLCLFGSLLSHSSLSESSGTEPLSVRLPTQKSKSLPGYGDSVL
jgi:hypothetical protein